MREISAGLQAHLDTRQTTLCWCWKITKNNGDVLGFTNHDRDLTFDSVTYRADTGMLASEMESRLGMSVDQMEVEGAVDSVEITEDDIHSGQFDNAEVVITLVNWEDVSERLVLKTARLGEITRGKTVFVTELLGLSDELNVIKGRFYQYTCDATLGDNRCGVDLTSATYKGTGAITNTNGSSYLIASGLGSFTDQWFDKGILTFTSGANSGLSYEVKSHTTTTAGVELSLWQETSFTMAVTDDFTVTAGCSKLFRTCKSKFSNGAKFKGFPHIPGVSVLTKVGRKKASDQNGEGYFNGRD